MSGTTDRQKLIKALAVLLGLIFIVFLLAVYHKNSSMTLSEYEMLQNNTSSPSESVSETPPEEGSAPETEQ